MITFRQQKQHFFNIGSIAIAYVAEDEDRYKDKTFAKFCKNIAEYDVVHLLKHNVCASIQDNLRNSLNFAYRSNKKYLLYCQVGNLITWEYIIKEIRKTVFFNSNVKFIGHILEASNGSYYIHPQFFLIDVKWAISNKCDSICNENLDLEWEGPILKRSRENFHDNYTPIWVKATDNYKNFVGRGKGANIIDALARSGANFMPWQSEVRTKKKFLYPTVKDEIVKHKNEIINELTHTKVYIANTEDIRFATMLKKVNLDMEFDICFSPAAGVSWFLLPYYLKAKSMFVYDVSIHALNMVDRIKTNWNGRNYKTFITENFLDHAPNLPLFAPFPGPHLDNADKLIHNYGDNFVSWWQKNKNGPYRQINLCNFSNFKRLLVDNHKDLNVFFNLSNIFHFKPLAVFNSLNERILLLKQIRDFMLENYKSVFFYGTSPVEVYTIAGDISDEKLFTTLNTFK